MGCPICYYAWSGYQSWLQTRNSNVEDDKIVAKNLDISAKHANYFEPIYIISTKNDNPLFDESFRGRVANKRQQCYHMWDKDFKFMYLDKRL